MTACVALHSLWSLRSLPAWRQGASICWLYIILAACFRGKVNGEMDLSCTKMLFDQVQERWPVQQSCLQGTPKPGGPLASALPSLLFICLTLDTARPHDTWNPSHPPPSPPVVSLL